PILLEDLERSYEQAAKREPPRLPAKTTSFQHWAGFLEDHARSPELRAELGYWAAEARRSVSPLPVDFAGANDERSCRTVWVALEESETEALLREVPAAYGTQIQDALLAALAQALGEWRGGTGPVLVDLEGHGREEGLSAGVDLTRTVGWFTTFYPILLDLGDASGPGAALQRVKEQLRSVPRRGIGYGLLRYLAMDSEVSGQLAELPAAEVSFNYAGQGGGARSEGSAFRAAQESGGLSHSLAGERHYLLDINGQVAGGRLRMGFTYSSNVHGHETISRLATEYLTALRELIAHCLSPDTAGYTPSDFPLMSLSQDELDELVAEEE